MLKIFKSVKIAQNIIHRISPAKMQNCRQIIFAGNLLAKPMSRYRSKHVHLADVLCSHTHLV